MKRSIYTYIHILLLVLLFSCTESQFDGSEVSSLSPRYLNVLCENSNKTITFPAIPKDKSFFVTSICTPWNITNTASWVKINMTSGGEISGNENVAQVNLSLEENKQADTVRSSILYVNSLQENYQAREAVTIIQQSPTPFIEPEMTNVVLSGGENILRLHVKSNCAWEPTTDDTWISVVREGDDLLISSKDNSTDHIKTSTIVLRGKASSIVYIAQEPAGVKVLTDTLKYDDIAATYSLNIQADMNWTASTNQSWIQVSPTNGNKEDHNLAISVAPNASKSIREGSVYIQVGSQNVKIPIIQYGYYFDMLQDSIVFNSHGGVMQVDFSTNDAWTARTDNLLWVTLSDNSGSNDDKLLITVSENSSASSRICHLFIQPSHYPDLMIPIIQRGRYLEASLDAINIFAKGGTSDLVIKTDADYYIQQDGSWFNINHYGDYISVSASHNNSNNWREGSITLISTDIEEGELKVSIPIRQAYNEYVFTKGSYKIDVDYNLLSSFGFKLDIICYSSDINYNSSGITGINRENYHDNGNVNNGQDSGINIIWPNERGDYDDYQKIGFIKSEPSESNDYDNGHTTGVDKSILYEKGDINNGQNTGIDKSSPNENNNYDEGKYSGILKNSYSKDKNYDNEQK